MAEAVQIGNATLYCGDCLDVLKTLPDASIEAIVTDPPYGLAFMGKHWDYDVPAVEVWQECLRVLKPGGHLLAFAGTRTFHRMAVRIEDAGFEIRDMIAWVYGSGFPKSLDVSKALDKMAGAEREILGENPNGRITVRTSEAWAKPWNGSKEAGAMNLTSPTTDGARQWQGWGTALKPALEPIALCRKPLDGTVAQNVMTHGTGGINIDGCRVNLADSESPEDFRRVDTKPSARMVNAFAQDKWSKEQFQRKTERGHDAGRFPANLIHDGSDEVVALFPQTTSGGSQSSWGSGNANLETTVYGGGWSTESGQGFHDTGSAARFFYCAKADKSDRDEGLDAMQERIRDVGDHRPSGTFGERLGPRDDGSERKPAFGRNHHPTVKPTDLMRYLCRLVTPPGGTVLDPFMGSGSTGRGAALEGFHFIGIEREPDYLAIAQARIKAAQRQPDLFHAAVAA